ncbi:hypothetical protein H6F51_21795 [Cyanobacteria bacterium FACHB-DQ100]|nr:hypothetical protein [Cyanobacteria bacterium FACHB-DQ100]
MRRIAFEKTVLKEVGLKKRWTAQIGLWPFLITIAVAIAGFIGISKIPESEKFIKKEDYFGLAATIIAIGGAAVAYEQWIETKKDSALDKYYERLNLTNEGFYRWNKTREMFPHFWNVEGNIPYEWVMYVYLELDNLEYATTKYQDGSMEPEIVFRSLVTFISRCQSKTFLKLAESLVEKSIGYSPTTKAVVIKIANPCNIGDPQVESWLYQQLEPRKVGALIS